MSSITISIGDEEAKILEKRAKKNLMTLREQIEDIIRKSAVRTKSGSSSREVKVDDPLVSAFSRSKRGRKSSKRG